MTENLRGLGFQKLNIVIDRRGCSPILTTIFLVSCPRLCRHTPANVLAGVIKVADIEE
jgi:hypothetical protein